MVKDSSQKEEKKFQLGCDYERIAAWTMSKTCNFQCDYCFYNSSQMGLAKKAATKFLEKATFLNPYRTRVITPEAAKDFFDRTAKRWYLILSGGEPFIYPKFTEIAATLTERHLITVATNLSRPVEAFIKAVNPKNVRELYASLHLGERRKMSIKLSVEEFLEKAIKLRDAGFTVNPDFVLYPPLIKEYKNIFAQFKKEGFFIEAKVFRGLWDGRRYPAAFTKKERTDFLAFIPHPVDRASAFNSLSFKGKICSAGIDFFRITPNGTITRCTDDWEKIGNIFTGVFKPHAVLKKCRSKECGCTVAPKEGCVI
jgi:MoaA/NifB/PqqE/SkfB family radical SAM enzyme